MLTSYLRDRRIRGDIAALDDAALTDAAFAEFWRSFYDNPSVDAVAKATVLEQLQDAAGETPEALSPEGRGRLQSFLFNARRHAGIGTSTQAELPAEPAGS